MQEQENLNLRLQAAHEQEGDLMKEPSRRFSCFQYFSQLHPLELREDMFDYQEILMSLPTTEQNTPEMKPKLAAYILSDMKIPIKRLHPLLNGASLIHSEDLIYRRR